MEGSIKALAKYRFESSKEAFAIINCMKDHSEESHIRDPECFESLKKGRQLLTSTHVENVVLMSKV